MLNRFGNNTMGKTHSNFYIIEAENNFELGKKLGRQFGVYAQKAIAENSMKEDWALRQKKAAEYLDFTDKYFPEYVTEMRGYAEGAKVDFLSLWTLSLEDELYEMKDKCTTIITNDGKLIAHNEDWAKNTENNICLLLKKIGGLAILELYYFNTLGGNASSVNSNGFICSVNTLTHKNAKFGIPRNVVNRFISETKAPEVDSEKLKELPRGLGSNFNIVDSQGKIWNIECNSTDAILAKPSSPYVHTNHYLGDLKTSDKSDNWDGTFDRYEAASSKIKAKMNLSAIIDLMNDHSRGEIFSIMNERTIGKMVLDVENKIAKVWLKREEALGWIDYSLDKLLGW